MLEAAYSSRSTTRTFLASVQHPQNLTFQGGGGACKPAELGRALGRWEYGFARPPKLFSHLLPNPQRIISTRQASSQLAGYQHLRSRTLSGTHACHSPIDNPACVPVCTVANSMAGVHKRFWEGAPKVELPGLAPPAAYVSPRSLRLSVGLPPSEVRPPVEGVSLSSSEFLFRLCSLPTPRHFETKAIPQQQCSARAAPAMW